MQAVIMAGGKGTRLASITKNIPKPMVLIDGKPLLEHQIENLKDNGVNDIILVVGHLGNIIQEYFGDGSKFGTRIRYYEEKTPLGTAGALTKIQNQLEETFFLVFGDLFININYNKFLLFHKNTDSCISLFAHPNSHPYDSDIILTDDNDRVIGWSYKKDERNEDYQNLVNAGLYIVEKEVVDQVRKIQVEKCEDKVDLEKDLIIPNLTDFRICAYQSTEYVKDIGTPDRLDKVTNDYIHGICERRNLKNKQKCIFLDRDGTINKYVGLLREVDQFELETKAAEAVRMINESEYLAIVITNQPVIARGECSIEKLKRIHNRMYTLLGKEGAYIDGLYYCPHHPDKGFEGEIPELKIKCNCRKPNTGLLKQAEKDFNADLENSWFVGDTSMDVQTGKNAGMNTVMLRSGDPQKNKFNVSPDIMADNLLDAITRIMSVSKS